MNKFMRRVLLAYCLSIIALPGHAATYYLSSSQGDDGNDGLSAETPWRTLDKLNSEALENGAIVLFKRGDTFRGGVKSKPKKTGIIFTAYGEGEKPIVSGSVLITGWTPTNNPVLPPQVYEADVSPYITVDSKGNENKIQHLFINGELMTIARFPNVDSPMQKHWLKVGATAENDAFTDPVLAAYGKPANYWKGATLRIRTYSWYYKVFEVTGYSAANGKITAADLGNQLPKWGYFLDGKLEELDHPGEWYYDPGLKRVYFYPKNGIDPNKTLIEGTTYNGGLSVASAQHNTVVDNLSFRHFAGPAVSLNSSDNPIIQNCDFIHNRIGITNWNNPNMRITNNRFEDQLNIGIQLKKQGESVQNSIIEDNTILRSGMYPLYCARYSGVCYGVGIGISGQGIYYTPKCD